MGNYIGKICPYCKTPLVEGDTVVFCSVCEMPHHLSCWQDNQGCTTFGCTGSIKEIIGNDSRTATTPAAPQPAPVPVTTPNPVQVTPITPAPAPSQVEQPEASLETLYESEETAFMSGLPIALENRAITIDRTKDSLFACCTFRSISDKMIKAVLIEVSCLDVWGSTLGEPITFQYLDLKIKRGSTFGQTNSIDLPDKTTRKIQVVVKKVLFEDDSIVSGDGAVFTIPAPVPLSKHFGSDALAVEYVRETSPEAQFVPDVSNDYWRCSCGSLNTGADEKCYNCGCTKGQLTAALNPETLNANMLSFAEAKRAAAEKAQAEQAERIRLAEEQFRLEQERKDQMRLERERKEEEIQLKIAENLVRKKKRRKKVVVAILLVVALLGSGAVFFGIPYFNYRAACSALAGKQYDAAYQAFLALDGFLDSDEMATEARYQKACSYQNHKCFDQALEIFKEIVYYKDSREKVNECMYGYVLANKNNYNFTTYQYLLALKSAGYKDASTIYANLYNWRVTGVINTNADNYSTHEKTISKYCDYLHFWVTLSGGKPGEKVNITHTVIFPDGSTSVSSWHWENQVRGDKFGAEWTTGLYSYPHAGATGTLTVKIINKDTGELLGTLTTKVTN